MRTSKTTKQSTSTPSFQEEIANYKAFKIPAYRCNPLLFWRDHAKDYPVMAITARRVFCISASSAQSERDFSSVGHTITDVRSLLSPGRVEDIELLRWSRRAGLPLHANDDEVDGHDSRKIALQL
jgi:hypothetical protein